jgi:hypothetical protein
MINKARIAASIDRKIRKIFLSDKKRFPGSEKYWIQRYNIGRNSGTGSFDQLAKFKAEILNKFVKDNNIATIIEYGCGDGNQLRIAEYPSYIGFDVSPTAIALCREAFQKDKTKRFNLMSEYKGEKAQLTLSLDVIYHLVEDDVYHAYMERLFVSSERFVIIYSSDYEEPQKFHERRRQFTRWVETNQPQSKLISHILNPFPFDAHLKTGSLSDFYIYKKTGCPE